MRRFKFVKVNHKFEYKRSILQKLSVGKARVLSGSIYFKVGQEVKLPPQTMVSYNPGKIIQLTLF